MAQATWKDVTLAQSAQTEVVEGNHYFPVESINREHFQEVRIIAFVLGKGRQATITS